MQTCDVVIIGAGPTGLTLAAELARLGRSVTILEKRPQRSPLSRAFGVHARTLEVLDQRGLADALVGTGVPAPGLLLSGRTEVDLTTLPSRFPFVLITAQSHVDALLETHAVAVGAHVVRGAEVTSVREEGGGIRVGAVTETGPLQWQARYAVATDGAHSPVRDLAGLDFPGRSVLRSVMLADVHLSEPPATLVTVDASKDAFAFVAPFGDGRHRVIAWDRRRQAADGDPLEESDIRGALQAAMGTDFGWERVDWMSRFHCDERQLASYRSGRLFFAGDAAHTHSPAGGQGMNTGIQDAVNLGWKLAAVLGGADERVLDTYDAERHPVGRRVLRSSGALIRVMTLRSAPARFLRTHLLPRVLRLAPLSRRVALTISGVGIDYGHRPGEDPAVGTRVADLPLAGRGPDRLYAAMRTAGFVLVLEHDADEEVVPEAPGLQVVRRADPGPALLVRPDGHIAWSGAREDGRWREAWIRWCGTDAAAAVDLPR